MSHNENLTIIVTLTSRFVYISFRYENVYIQNLKDIQTNLVFILTYGTLIFSPLCQLWKPHKQTSHSALTKDPFGMRY